jgi:hypothetical protein
VVIYYSCYIDSVELACSARMLGAHAAERAQVVEVHAVRSVHPLGVAYPVACQTVCWRLRNARADDRVQAEVAEADVGGPRRVVGLEGVRACGCGVLEGRVGAFIKN